MTPPLRTTADLAALLSRLDAVALLDVLLRLDDAALDRLAETSGALATGDRSLAAAVLYRGEVAPLPLVPRSDA